MKTKKIHDSNVSIENSYREIYRVQVFFFITLVSDEAELFFTSKLSTESFFFLILKSPDSSSQKENTSPEVYFKTKEVILKK